MISSKAEALTKWCPFARQVWADFDAAGAFTTLGSTPAFNMVHENRGSRERRIRCIADECMMWRELGRIGLPATADAEAQSVDLGYCGLGGDPLPSSQALAAMSEAQKRCATLGTGAGR